MALFRRAGKPSAAYLLSRIQLGSYLVVANADLSIYLRLKLFLNLCKDNFILTGMSSRLWWLCITLREV